MFQYFCEKDKERNYSDYNFLMPSVSVGNVGQLAMETLLTYLKPPKIARVWQKFLYSVAASDASHKLTTSCELFLHEESKTVMMQLRTPIRPRWLREYISQLIVWIQEKQFKNVVVVTSLSTFDRSNISIDKALVRFLLSTAVDSESLRSLQCVPLEARARTEMHFGPVEVYESLTCYSRELYKLCKHRNIPLVVLVAYAEGGGDPRHSHMLANLLNKWLQLAAEEEIPALDLKNWDPAKPPPDEIY